MLAFVFEWIPFGGTLKKGYEYLIYGSDSEEYRRQREPGYAATKFADLMSDTPVGEYQEKCSYSSVLQKAKNDLKFLLVYLHSKEHDLSDNFVQKVLCSEKFTGFLSERRDELLFWGASVEYSEGFQCSDILQAYSFPFVSLLVYKQGDARNISGMKIVLRQYDFPELAVSSPQFNITAAVDNFVKNLELVIRKENALLLQLKQEKVQREMERSLREQQDQAYEESLRKDRLKAEQEEQKRLEEERRLELERQKEEALKERRAVCISRLKPEPEVGAENVIRIVFRMPSGKRVERRFHKDDNTKVDDLYCFIGSLEEMDDVGDFNLCFGYPKVSLDEKERLLKDVEGFGISAMLVVEEIFSEE